jgi:hypothetical protein
MRRKTTLARHSLSQAVRRIVDDKNFASSRLTI